MDTERNVWISSDHHIGHDATWQKFKRNDGTPLRPFRNNYEMHATMIERHNAVVKPDDLCLFLGDVAFSGQDFDAIMPCFNGQKYLIRGNHDKFSEGRYRNHFMRILGCYQRDNFMFTHIPIHPESLARWKANIHGHLHANNLRDKRYINCSVEQINYTPVLFADIKARYNGK